MLIHRFATCKECRATRLGPLVLTSKMRTSSALNGRFLMGDQRA